MVGDGTGEESLAGSGGTVEEDSFGLGDAEGVEEFGVLDGELDDLLDFLDLLVESADHFVGGIGDFLDHHEGDEGVLLRGEDGVELVRVGAEGDAEVGGEIGEFDGGGEIDDVTPFRLDFDEYFLLAHELDHLPDVGAWLLQQLQLFPQQSHYCRSPRRQSLRSRSRLPGSVTNSPRPLSELRCASRRRRFSVAERIAISDSSIFALK